MTLLASSRHRPTDLAAWHALGERSDAAQARILDWGRMVGRAVDDIITFATAGRCYVATSWGKDSVVVAHLAELVAMLTGAHLPIVWIRREPIDNPDCALVRDAFAARFPDADLREVLVECERDPAHPGRWWTRGVLGRTDDDRPKQVGFARARERFGARYISGVRGAESGARTRRMRAFGTTTDLTCAPIGWWSTAAVFAYLHRERLPVHPAYACTVGGVYDRERIRVGSIGGPQGRGHGRAEWERTYYPEVVRRLEGGA